jgi:hypothetical protein
MLAMSAADVMLSEREASAFPAESQKADSSPAAQNDIVRVYPGKGEGETG